MHFTEELLAALRRQGVGTVFVTLHVGAGTFQPIRVEQVEQHRMEEEEYELSNAAAERINAAKAAGRKIIAVGTTTTRALESACPADGKVQAGRRRTSLFIHPGYRFRVIDALITNFHLPRSTLLMLVAAFAGLDFLVAIDFYINETTRYADVILPTPSPAELASYELGFYHLSVRNVAKWSPAVVSPPPIGFLRYQDPKVGYSFDYPNNWTGQPLSDKEASEQRMSAGAMFTSQKDAAFLTAVWNELDKANNPANENDLIVEVILKSMSSSDGTTKLEELARRVETRNGLIKTYLDLKAVFQTQGQSAPLDFLGKAVIVRASRGILLVAAFYSKDSPSNAATATDQIIASARAPE